jgi:hypothetical protein
MNFAPCRLVVQGAVSLQLYPVQGKLLGEKKLSKSNFLFKADEFP